MVFSDIIGIVIICFFLLIALSLFVVAFVDSNKEQQKKKADEEAWKKNVDDFIKGQRLYNYCMALSIEEFIKEKKNDEKV